MTNKASPSLRLVAFLIDVCCISAFYFLSAWYIVAASNLEQLFGRTVFVFIFFLFALIVLNPLYFVFATSRWGGTLGKLITGIEVVDERGRRISFTRAFYRNYVGYAVSSIFFYLGFIWVAIDKERRGWHDMIANTFVVVKKPGGILVGLILLFLLICANVLIGFQIYWQSQANKSMYQEIGQEIVTEMQNVAEENPSPLPSYP